MKPAGAALRGTPGVVLAGTRGQVATAWRRHYAEDLVLVEKKGGATTRRRIIPVAFVPLTGSRGR